jgi:hypothetical protein
LQLAKVFRASLGDLLPTLPSKLDGGGIFLFWQNLEGVASTPDGIMHEQPHATKPSCDQSRAGGGTALCMEVMTK